MAKIFEIEDQRVAVKVAALIGGDGVDLVVRPVGRRSRTVQVSAEKAREIAAALLFAADETGRL